MRSCGTQAGITGTTRVGIVDFFDLAVWNPSENGPVPDAAHQFCPDLTQGLCIGGQINSSMGDRHGVAVAEILKDMAPGAELFLATTATTAETQAAIDWFAHNGVHIVTRSLGAPYDGPGDGTGPLDAVVDYAAARSITWFNSGGNDAAFRLRPIHRRRRCLRLRRLLERSRRRHDVAHRPAERRRRLRRHPLGERLAPAARRHHRLLGRGLAGHHRSDSHADGAPRRPSDLRCPSARGRRSVLQRRRPGQALFLRIHAEHNYSPSAPDTVEVATFFGDIEPGRRSAAFSSAKPVVDSRNPALVAVGAIDPANGSTGIAFYSSQGPTNDGRIKPDVSAPSCVASTVYAPMCFNGTSAASPVAAGMAALLFGKGLAVPGMPLAALVKHLVRRSRPARTRQCLRRRRIFDCRPPHRPQWPISRAHSPRSRHPFACSTLARHRSSGQGT